MHIPLGKSSGPTLLSPSESRSSRMHLAALRRWGLLASVLATAEPIDESPEIFLNSTILSYSAVNSSGVKSPSLLISRNARNASHRRLRPPLFR